MYWTLELASKIEDAPWPATKDELIDYAMRSGARGEAVWRTVGVQQADLLEAKIFEHVPTKSDE